LEAEKYGFGAFAGSSASPPGAKLVRVRKSGAAVSSHSDSSIVFGSSPRASQAWRAASITPPSRRSANECGRLSTQAAYCVMGPVGRPMTTWQISPMRLIFCVDRRSGL
jgi:hypothetical protein